ncbi:MAG: hydrogenase expression/formation protein [Deltaproteobacteria bacterium]|nr:hydrogenase expression/formation protein [Deltaproteobacteria bacterium]
MNKKQTSEGTPFLYPVGKLPAEELARLLAKYTHHNQRVVVRPGVGRDATVISFPDGYLVAKTDPITFATDMIGWYVVHVNANDVAVMGGIPRWFLATVLLPEKKAGPSEVEAIFAQISEACEELGVVLCGGHTEITGGLDRPIIVGQMLGEVERAKLIVPERACPGDDILLTKGIAIEGTALIARERGELQQYLDEDFLRRCRNFLKDPGISVVREARIASRVAEVHAMHDPTEGGLATGLHELAWAAGVGMRVEMEKIFILPETALLCQEFKLDPLGLIASGALLLVAPTEESSKIIAALAAEGIPVSVIGKIGESEEGIKLLKQGKVEDLPLFKRDEVARLFERGGS